MLLSAGDKLGPYEILAQIGAGGMGEVYRARDTRLQRTVAIKVLPPEVFADAERQRRFLQEARAASALNHPNIVTLHDIASQDGVQYLVLEYVAGQTLKQSTPPGGLPAGDLLDYGLQIAAALGAAHAAGIVHRDIKPSNLMVTPEKRIKVLDFGLAKAGDAVGSEFEETRTRPGCTAPGVVLGTAAYMSPEQTRGEPLDGRSDIFSLGSVLYEAATGRPPFAGASMLAVMHEVASVQPARLTSIRPDLPRELEGILARAMAKDRQERYATAGEMAAALMSLQAQPQPARTSRRRWGAAAGLGGVLAIAAAALAYYAWPNRERIDSIAVLPFLNMAKDPGVDYQADGLTEEIINGLAQVPNLKVKGRVTVFRFKGRDLDPETIGKQLDVRAVLMGKVVKNGDRLSVQADLVASRDGSQLWGKQYDRTAAEMQTVPGEIVEQVMAKIRIQGSDRKRQRRRAVNAQAYDLYLQGRHALSEMTTERVKQSMVYFQQAIVRDPNYAAAYAGLADSYSYMGVFEMAAPREAMPKAKEAALKALELDSEAGEAYTSLGIVQSLYEWDWAGSGKRFQRAVELNPGGAYDQHWYGHYFEFMGQWEQAERQMRKAVALDPLNPMPNSDLGWELIVNHHYDEAIGQLRKVVELDPADPLAHVNLALALEAKGRREESLAENDRARRSSDGLTFVAGTMAGVYCRQGRREEARKILEELDRLAGQRYVAPLQRAMVHLALGEAEQCFRLLESALNERSSNLQFVGSDPVFDHVRQDPRFIRVRERLGLPEASWAVEPMPR